jgi:hypothetical protein
MSNKFYSHEINYLMENSISPSLDILLEEKEDFGDEEAFDTDAESSDSKKKPDSEGDPESSDDSEGDPESSDDSEGDPKSSVDSEGVSEANIENLASSLKDVTDYMKSVASDATSLFQVQDFLSNDIAAKSADVSDSLDVQEEGRSRYTLSSKNKLTYFLNEKVNIEDVEKDIEAVDNIIDKGSELIDKFKKGSKLQIPQYVESSINAYRNFDNLFSKESIIKQAAMNLIVLNSGARAEENIREFEELFHEELHKQFGIEYEEHALITKPHHVATGAVKQG